MRQSSVMHRTLIENTAARFCFATVLTLFPKISGLFIVMGTIIFVAKFVEESDAITEIHFSLSVGFGLCVASGVLSLVAGILYIAPFLRKRRWHRLTYAGQCGVTPKPCIYQRVWMGLTDQ